MNGFLSRLAARTGGAPVGITPRVPAWFGHTEALGGATASALTTTSAVPDCQGDNFGVRGNSPDPRPTTPMPVQATLPPQPPAAPVPRDPMRVGPDGHPEPGPGRGVGTVRAAAVAVLPPPPPRAETGRAQRASRRQRPIMPRVPAVPAYPAAVARPPVRTAAEPASSADRGPDVVHISIGRVEVRAAAPAPAAVAPAPIPSDKPTPTLSLADYLRGGRVRR